ncbi:MAG TPA: hypothetical protein VIG44_09930, partial [Thermomicrobiales bacterium]
MTIWRNPQRKLRTAWRALAVMTVALLATATIAPVVIGAESPLAGPSIVYFPATGHNVNGDFLEFWHANGGADRIGNPITEEVQDGKTVKQYFERGVVEYTPAIGLSFGLLGTEAVRGRHDAPFMPLTRDQFGPDRAGHLFFSQTGHSVTGLFANYWQQNGALGVFGFPLSEPTREAVGANKEITTVQYFERARFEVTKDANGQDTVRLGNLGKEFAQSLDIGVNPAPKDGGAMDYSASIWPKWIDVNL